jgi:hypothetical protein
MGASASLERVAFAPLLSGSLPPQLGRLRSTGECGSLGRSVCRAPPLGAAMSADGGDGGNDRLLGSRRLARALSSLQTPTEQLAEDDQKILWSRRIARAVESFSSEAPVPTPAPSSETLFPTTEAAISHGSEETASGASDAQGPGVAAARAEPTAAAAAADASVERRAFSGPPTLPDLSAEDIAALAAGERVQRQTRSGRVGTGMVVVDVAADVDTCLCVLTDVDRYPERISTVRKAITYEYGDRLRRTQFQLSRFRLQINTELRCEKEHNLLSFKMDPQRPAPFLNQADGFWHLQDVTVLGGATATRIWLVASIACSPVLPGALVDYAAARALPRATTWLRPVMEDMAQGLPPICKQPGVFASEDASAQRRPVR